MKLVAGLGNPGQAYEKTLHNIGFRVIDILVDDLNAGKPGKKFQSHYWKITYRHTDVLLLKPLTYMNLSGNAVGEAMRYFKVESPAVLVITDDLNLPPGKIRYREKGGHGGHNGLRDIIKHIGDNFPRIRIGIGKPNDRRDTKNFVLSAPDHSQCNNAITNSIHAVPQHVYEFISGHAVNVLTTNEPLINGT